MTEAVSAVTDLDPKGFEFKNRQEQRSLCPV